MSSGENQDAQRVTVELEVRYAETDQMGLVHHSVCAIWFEVARTRLCRLTGFHYADIEKLGYFLVVTQLEVRYLHGARYGDTVTVTCWLADLKSRVLRFAYEVHRGEQLLASGATEHLWLDRATGRPCRMPAVLREPFLRAAGKL